MSGAIALLAAMGGAPGVINPSLPDGDSIGGTALFSLVNDGTFAIGDGSGPATGSWVTPNAFASYYQVQVDVTSGSFSSGTTGSYLDLSSTRTWTKTSAGTVTFTVTIREKATGLVRSTQTGKTLTVT